MPNDGWSKDDKIQNNLTIDLDKTNKYINGIYRDFMFNIVFLLERVNSAGREFESILKSKGSKPLGPGIFGELLLSLLPGYAERLFTVGTAAITSTIEGQKYVQTAIDEIESAAKSLTSEIQNGTPEPGLTADQLTILVVNASLRQEIEGLQKIADKVIDLTSKMEGYATALMTDALKRKDATPKILSNIKEKYRKAGLEGLKRLDNAGADAWERNLLYDMLRKYVSTYVVITISTLEGFTQGDLDRKAIASGRVEDLPQYRDDDLVDGLNGTQRASIYARFGSKKWGSGDVDGLRPPIDSYKDLISFWNATTRTSKGQSVAFPNATFYESLRLARYGVSRSY